MQPGRPSSDCTKHRLQNLTQMSTLGDRGTHSGAFLCLLFLYTVLNSKWLISVSELEKKVTSAPRPPGHRLGKALWWWLPGKQTDISPQLLL